MRWLTFGLLAGVVALFIYVSADLPDWGDVDAPANTHLSPQFTELTVAEVEVPNLVAVVLADFRSIDTLGEVIVVYAAGMAVFLILGRGRRDDGTA